jgi:acyl-CoA hydrolase
MSGPDITEHLKSGDTVLIGQATAEPPVLVEAFIEAAQRIDGLTALCGYTLSDAWTRVREGHPYVKTYAAHGALRALVSARLADVMPVHYSQMEQLIVEGVLPVDVVLLQVAPADADGYYGLGATVDWAAVAAETARVVLVEVNDSVPHTRSTRRLHRSQVTAAVEAPKPLAGSPSRPPNEVESEVARHTATLIPDGATLQLGVGALADAVARALHDRRDLRVRSGLVGDWLVDLHEAGALDLTPGSVVTGIALGADRLYAFLREAPFVAFAPLAEQISSSAMAVSRPFVSVNSAIEVDLLGQANAEVVGGRYVGAVGGQVDFFRATRGSVGGLAVIALGSTSPSGTSRIVSQLSGPVTSLKSDVDVVVTEWGIADLRGASLSQRVERLAAVADPRHRESLLATRPAWA